MIASGDQFIACRSGGVVGAIVPWRGAFAGVAPAHIFHAAGTHKPSVGGLTCLVSYISLTPTWPSFPSREPAAPPTWESPAWARPRSATPGTACAAASPTPHGPLPMSCFLWAICPGRERAAAPDSGRKSGGPAALPQHAHLQGHRHLGRDDKAGDSDLILIKHFINDQYHYH